MATTSLVAIEAIRARHRMCSNALCLGVLSGTAARLCSVCGLALFSDYYSVIQKLLCNISSVQDLL